MAVKTTVPPTAGTLPRFLEEAARLFGPAPALWFKPGIRYERWTYEQLWESAGRVASLLQQRGLGSGDRVILWGPNCPAWVVAFFGCTRAGLIIVPLDVRSTPDYVQRVVSGCEPVFAFVSRLSPESHRQLPMPSIRLEELEELSGDLPPPRPAPVAPDDVAEIMYTSGTTGNPKGVMLTHRNILSCVEAAGQFVPAGSDYRFLSILPLSHMFEQAGSLLSGLRCGSSLTFVASRQPSILFRTMQERKVTAMLLPPQMLDLIIRRIEGEVSHRGRERLWRWSMRIARRAPHRVRRLLFGQIHSQFGGCLDLIMSGGAPLDPETGAKWSAMGVRVLQAYGTTETAPAISMHPLNRPRFDSVGLPLPGIDVRIEPDGEIIVRGPNVSPGYWQDPERTAEAFQDGWYRTGDLGHIDEDGFLHLRGRKKDLIVLPSGQNVFPEDVEDILRQHPAITDAAVVGLPVSDGSADRQVHAALLLEDPAAAPEAVSWANRRLAEHQQVRGHTVWPDDDFPRTLTLKVKKHELEALIRDRAAEPATATPTPQTAPGPGQSPLERVLREVSETPAADIAPHMTLGEGLNLDSLRRVELLSAIEGELGVFLDEDRVGPDTTVRQLKEMIARGSAPTAVTGFPRWGMSWWARAVRGAAQRALIFPVLRLAYRLDTPGAQTSPAPDGPVLFAANHNLGLDAPLILKAMPAATRRRVAVAAAADLWRSPKWAIANPLLGNCFPFAREGPLKPSLENLGLR